MKSTVSWVFEDLKFKISEGYDQFGSKPSEILNLTLFLHMYVQFLFLFIYLGQMLQPTEIVQQILVQDPLNRGDFFTLCMILRPPIQL